MRRGDVEDGMQGISLSMDCFVGTAKQEPAHNYEALAALADGDVTIVGDLGNKTIPVVKGMVFVLDRSIKYVTSSTTIMMS